MQERRRRAPRALPAVAAAVMMLTLAACAIPSQTTSSRSFGAPVRPVPPDSLVGLDFAGVIGLLGEPELRRREPPAEVWQYRNETCVVDLFFYNEAGVTPSASTGQAAVVGHDARLRSGVDGPVDAARCLGEIAARPTAPPTA